MTKTKQKNSLADEWAERCKLCAEGNKLYDEGYKLHDEGRKLWNNVVKAAGLTQIWSNSETCQLSNGEIYHEIN